MFPPYCTILPPAKNKMEASKFRQFANLWVGRVGRWRGGTGKTSKRVGTIWEWK